MLTVTESLILGGKINCKLKMFDENEKLFVACDATSRRFVDLLSFLQKVGAKRISFDRPGRSNTYYNY